MNLLPIALVRQPQPARTYSTFDPAAKGSTVTLSGGNLIASFGAGAPPPLVIASVPMVAGFSYYWEVQLSNLGVNIGVASAGITSAGYTAARFLGDLAADYGLRWGTGAVVSNNISIATYGAFALNDVASFVLNLVANTLAIYKNGVYLGVVSVAAGSYNAAACGSSNTGDQVVFNANALRSCTYGSPNGVRSGIWS